ncbi:MAG: hypothetical protein KAR39_03050 [Thermoplasmata archaeon]|nr:hypothetical protein [Thermoplasmata archaeon]
MPGKIDELEPQAKGNLYRWLQGLSDENSSMVKVLKIFLDEVSSEDEKLPKPSERRISFEELEKATGMSSADIAIGLRNLIETGFVIADKAPDEEEMFALNDDPQFIEMLEKLASFAQSHWDKEFHKE